MIRIGIDISALQSGHSMRGIGAVVRNILRNLPKGNEYIYVFYVYKKTLTSSADELLSNSLFADMPYEVEYIVPRLPLRFGTGRYMTLFSKAVSKLRTLNDYRIGSPKYRNSNKLDAFIQPDQMEPLARLRNHARNYMIIYDLIPYVLEDDYMPGYEASRRAGYSRKASFKHMIKRRVYIEKVRFNVKKAHALLSDSEKTKSDFILYAHADPSRVHVIRLGAAVKSFDLTDNRTLLEVNRYIKTSWGYIKNKATLESNAFLMFIGGADKRRRLEDLVTAYNQLRATGSTLKLVLAGDTMLGPSVIAGANPIAGAALKESSYLEDIYFLGYISESERDWLYRNAVAFVFPSVYEGFGLPVIEAMGYGTPVISYPSEAVREVAHDNILYATSGLTVLDAVNRIRSMPKPKLTKMTDKAKAHALSYRWSDTVDDILKVITAA